MTTSAASPKASHTIAGTVLKNTPLVLASDGKVYLRPRPPRPGVDAVTTIRCVGCAHLHGMDLPSRGALCTCRLGNWKNGVGEKAWYNPTRLFRPSPALVRVARECQDHELQEVAS